MPLALLGLLTCYHTKGNLYLQYQPLEVERRKKINSWQNHLFSLEENELFSVSERGKFSAKKTKRMTLHQAIALLLQE